MNCGLTDDVLLRWIKQNRAVDTSEASASARSTTPPTAATFVRRHSKMHLKGQPVKGRRRPGAAANGVRPEPGTELTRSSERVECTRHRSASPERARVWAAADAPRAHTFESATASPATASSLALELGLLVRTSPRDHHARRLRRLAQARCVRTLFGACPSPKRGKHRVERLKCRLTDLGRVLGNQFDLISVSSILPILHNRPDFSSNSSGLRTAPGPRCSTCV